MGHYKSNVRDLEFNLFELFKIQQVFGGEEFPELDEDTARTFLAEMRTLAEGPLADSFAEGDRNPPVFDPETHSVAIPEAFKKSVKAITEAGWDRVGLQEELGGTPVPRSLSWAIQEMILGANPAVWMYSGGAGFAQIFYNIATDEQKKWAEFVAERAYEKLTESLQTFGGSGFLQDYPIEQYIRDAKIDSLYEGTTAIQAQDFFFRKIVKDQGKSLAFISGQIEEFVKSETGNGRLKAERALLATALEDVQGMAASMTGNLMAAQQEITQVYKVGTASVRFLMSVGDLLIGWLLQRQAAVAIEALDAGATGADKSFYEGKIAAASFFAKNMLPLLTSTRAVLENVDNDIMELDEAAF
ncbi:acyl-CoA dehydrogenase [Mycobacteroides abscessus]